MSGDEATLNTECQLYKLTVHKTSCLEVFWTCIVVSREFHQLIWALQVLPVQVVCQ